MKKTKLKNNRFEKIAGFSATVYYAACSQHRVVASPVILPPEPASVLKMFFPGVTCL